MKKFFSALTAILLAVTLAFSVGCQPDQSGDGGTKRPPKITEGDVCIDLVITHMPTKTEYKQGEKFNPAGLVFDAVYENGFDGDTKLNAGDLDSWEPRGALAADVTEIKLSFEGYQKAIPITVLAKQLNGMEITREPDIKAYSVGDELDLTGLTVRADYEEGVVEHETAYKVTDASGKEYKNGTVLEEAVKDLELTVSLTAGEVTKTDTFVIHVDTLIKVQAEDVVPEGEEIPADKSYTVITGKKTSEVIKNDCTWTGTGYLGNITKGVKVDFFVYSEEEIQNVSLVLIASSTRVDDANKTMLDCQFNKLYRVFVGDGAEREEIFIGDDVVIKGKPFPSAESGSSKWTNWADVSFGNIALKQGFNRVTVECIGSEKDADGKNDRTPNIDRLDIRLSDNPDQPAKGDVCTDIIINTMPAKTEYKVGEKFTAEGISFDAVYENGYDGDKGLGAARLTWEPVGALTLDDTTVKLKFKGVEKTISIKVTEKTLQSVEITREPDTKVYSKGGALNLGGLIVRANYLEGADANAVNYVVKDASGKEYTNGTILPAAGTLELIVSITVGGVTKTDSFTVTVYDGLTVQAEAVLKDGETAPTASSYTVFSGVGNITDKQGSGGGCIENVGTPRDGKPGTKVEFFVYSEVDITAAELSFTAASTNNNGTNKMDDFQFNKMFKITLGDGDAAQEFPVGDGVFIRGKEIPAGLSKWFLWDEVSVGKIDIKKGFNKITLECIGQIMCGDGSMRAANIDCLNIRTSDDTDVRGKEIKSVEITSNPNFLYYGQNVKFTAEGLIVKAVYDGAEVLDAKNYVIKTADGVRIGQNDNLGTEKRDVELFVEITEGGVTKKASFTVHVNSGDKITVQAEAVVSGEIPTTESYTVITGSKKFEEGKGSDGSASVSDVFKGTKIEFWVYSENAIKGADLTLTAASLDRATTKTNDIQFNTIFQLSVNDSQLNIGNGVKIAGRDKGSDSLWFLWVENQITKVDLQAGYTKITLECIGTVKDTTGGVQRAANLDKIDIKF